MSDAVFKPRIRLLLLLAGAAAGLLLAASGLIQRWSFAHDSLPEHVIARVGEALIPEERYLQLLHDLAADKRAPLSIEDRKFALNRLIDEELLITRGIELGLPLTSPAVRKAIAAEVIAQVAAEAEASVPDDGALHRLYESDPAFFTSEGRYRLRSWRLSGSSAAAGQQAADAYALISGKTPNEAAIRSTGLQPETLLPDALLTLTKIADYLGPELAQRVPRLEPGSYSEPILANGSFHILYLAAQEPGNLPAFEQIRPQVEAEYLRRAGDQALRDYLAWLRGRSEIIIAPDATQ